MHGMTKEIFKIAGKHTRRHYDEYNGVGCFLCAFGSPVDLNPHPFWSDLWVMLEQKGIDSKDICKRLHSASQSADYECTPYGQHEFLTMVINFWWYANRHRLQVLE